MGRTGSASKIAKIMRLWWWIGCNIVTIFRVHDVDGRVYECILAEGLSIECYVIKYMSCTGYTGKITHTFSRKFKTFWHRPYKCGEVESTVGNSSLSVHNNHYLKRNHNIIKSIFCIFRMIFCGSKNTQNHNYILCRSKIMMTLRIVLMFYVLLSGPDNKNCWWQSNCPPIVGCI